MSAPPRVRDLARALLPTLLFTAGALYVFLMRQAFGPSRSVRAVWEVAACAPLVSLAVFRWSSWRDVLDLTGWKPSAGWMVWLRSTIGVVALVAIAYGGPWLAVTKVADLASPFETMRWLLASSILIQGLAWRYVLGRRRLPMWMGVVYWLVVAGAAVGMWRALMELFS